MTRLWLFALSIWALCGLVAYKPHLLFGYSRYFSAAGTSAPKPKLRKLAKSYKVKNKHHHLMAKLNKSKKIITKDSSLEHAFTTLTQVDSPKQIAQQKPEPAPEKNSISAYFEKFSQTTDHSRSDSESQLNVAGNSTSPAQVTSATEKAARADDQTQDSLYQDEFAYDNSGSDQKAPEANDSVWTQEDLMTAFNQINVNVLQFGADYQSAFKQLTDDVMASATNDRVKNQMIDQIQKEFDAYKAYFDGSQISSL